MAQREQGSAVLLVLILTGLLAALGAGLATIASTERTATGNDEAGATLLYSAESLARRVIADLSSAAEWTSVLCCGVRNAFVESTRAPETSWRGILDLDAMTRDLQAQTDAASAWGANTPGWRLYAWGSMDALAGRVGNSGSPYLVAWVSDDPWDGDNDPATDANGALVIHAEAIGMGGLRRTVQVVLKRESADSSETGAGGTASADPDDGAGAAMARILPDPTQSPAAAAGSGRVRIVSWREGS